MFFNGTHQEISESIETIGAGFAVYEYVSENGSFILVSCNSLYEDVLGKTKKYALGQPLVDIFPRYISQPIAESFISCQSAQSAFEAEIIVEYKGEERYWRTIVSPVLDASNGTFRIIQTCVEITEKKILEKRLNVTMKRFEAVVQTAYDGIISIDADQNVKLVNAAAREIFGYAADEILGEPLTRLLPHQYHAKHGSYVAAFKTSMVDSRPMQTRAAVRGLRKDGTEFPVEVTISKIHVENSIEMTAVIRDISEKNRLMEELLIASRQDALTGLYNRRYFSEMLSAELLRFRRFSREFCLLMFDVDHFKKINDSRGHDVGDLVLKSMAFLLRAVLRETDILCRWGGEEFLVLLPETELHNGIHVAEKLRTALAEQEVDFGTGKLSFTVSVGIQSYTQTDMDLDSLISRVDHCLYDAKEKGRNRVSWEPRKPTRNAS